MLGANLMIRVQTQGLTRPEDIDLRQVDKIS